MDDEVHYIVKAARLPSLLIEQLRRDRDLTTLSTVATYFVPQTREKRLETRAAARQSAKRQGHSLDIPADV